MKFTQMRSKFRFYQRFIGGTAEIPNAYNSGFILGLENRNKRVVLFYSFFMSKGGDKSGSYRRTCNTLRS